MNSFVLFSQRRVGSTHLYDLLASHPQITLEPEVFHLNPRGERLGSWSEPGSTVAFVKSLFNREDSLIPGLKLKFPRQTQMYPEVWDFLRKQGDRVRLLCLHRENLLDHYRSVKSIDAVRKRYGSANKRAHQSQIPNIGSVELPIDQLLVDLQELEKERRDFFRSVRGFSRVYRLSYRELVSCPSLLSNVVAFLGGDPNQVLRSRIVKAAPLKQREAIENYTEVKRVLEGTHFQHFLE